MNTFPALIHDTAAQALFIAPWVDRHWVLVL